MSAVTGVFRGGTGTKISTVLSSSFTVESFSFELSGVVVHDSSVGRVTNSNVHAAKDSIVVDISGATHSYVKSNDLLAHLGSGVRLVRPWIGVERIVQRNLHRAA